MRQPDGVRVLDDRSLNGVFVNGERVEGRVLEDGDEIVVGRHRLSFLSVPAAPRRGPHRLAPRAPLRPPAEPAAPASAGPRSIAPHAQTIAVLSQKGGTGKTTAVRTLADASAP